jgi:hypothetical protein
MPRSRSTSTTRWLAATPPLLPGLDGVHVVAGDASITDAHAGALPADLILLCGVFGSITAALVPE